MTFSELWNDLNEMDGMWFVIFIIGIMFIVMLIRGDIDFDDNTSKKNTDEPTKETKKEPVKNITVEYNPLIFFYIYWTLSVLFFSRKFFWQWVNANVDTHLLGFIVNCGLWACTMSGIYFYKKFFMEKHEQILTENKAAQEKLKKEIEDYEAYQRGLNNDRGRYEKEIRNLKWEISKLNEELKKKAVILKTEPKKKRYGDDGFEF